MACPTLSSSHWRAMAGAFAEAGADLVLVGRSSETLAQAQSELSPLGRRVESIALDPTRPSTLYAATDQGFFVSDDGGSRWSPLSEGLQDPEVWQVLVDPFDPLTLYAGAPANGGLFVLTRSQAP